MWSETRTSQTIIVDCLFGRKIFTGFKSCQPKSTSQNTKKTFIMLYVCQQKVLGKRGVSN